MSLWVTSPLKNRQEAKEALRPSRQPPAVPFPLTRGLVQWELTYKGAPQQLTPALKFKGQK